jgi:hypothetical protein
MPAAATALKDMFFPGGGMEARFNVGHAVALCRVYRNQGNLRAAREAIGAAAQLAPSDPDVLAEQKQLRGVR